MPDSIPPLLGLHAFEASARHLSFAAAAAELHLSPSAISQRVRVLERHLGVSLFERRPRSLRLTEAGEAYLPAVRDLFEDLAAATSGLFGDTDRATLTVRVQASYASTWLAPRLPAFRDEFPHVHVHLVTAIWTDTLPPSEIDLEIRQGNGTWPGFRATKLHDDHAVAIYGEGHLARHGPSDTAALASRPRVQVLGFDDTWRRLFAHEATAARTPDAPPGAITVDTSLAALDIVANSDLWAIVPERFARQSVRSGRVYQAAGPTVPMRQEHYLLRRDNAERITGDSLAFERWLRAQDATDPAL
jgi:LysR family transcriptional regulator, glycine cleavage system transcriptional activator